MHPALNQITCTFAALIAVIFLSHSLSPGQALAVENDNQPVAPLSLRRFASGPPRNSQTVLTPSES
jgi:hypothetical protein